MSVSRPCYVTREQVQRAVDFKFTARITEAVDRAIESASNNVDGFMKRRFYTAIESYKWDWPNDQSADPNRLWLNHKELAGTPTAITTNSLGTPITIPVGNIILYPVDGPPFTRLELRLDKNSAFGGGPTPQQDISITGPYGYWQRTKAAGKLSANMTDTTTGLASVTNSNLVGIGDTLIVGTEKMLVTDKNMVTTGVTWAGLATSSAADNLIQVTDATVFAIGETLLADAERLWIADIAGNTLVVKRAWDGTVLTEHTGGTLYAARQLVITRGDLGTTAATHATNDACSVALVPAPIRDLALAEAIVQASEETGGFTGGQGLGGEGGIAGIGSSLADKWEEAEVSYGRKARLRVV